MNWEEQTALNQEHVQRPQPGDYWEDHLVGILQVVAVSHGMVIFFDQKEDLGDYWRWNSSKPRALSLEEFAIHLRYKYGDSKTKLKTWACVHPKKP